MVTEKLQVRFCSTCHKVNYSDAHDYHSNTCRDWLAGYDCMHLEMVEFCYCDTFISCICDECKA